MRRWAENSLGIWKQAEGNRPALLKRESLSARRVLFGDNNLVENELHVMLGECNHDLLLPEY